MAGSLTIYKASAGSGKTFTLAVRYIALVADNPDLYKHILAVTFTNKATSEMKERIIQHLYGIAHSLRDSEGYLKQIKQLLPQKDTGLIRQNTGTALNKILHDYSNFHIETIDSFFQRILRGMAKELQIGQGMQLELDTTPAIQNAVDRFIENIEPDSPELNWMLEFVNNSLDEGQNLRLNEQLSKFSKKLFQEDFQEKGKELRDYLHDIGKIKSFVGKLSETASISRKNIKDAALDVSSALSAQGLTTDNLSGYLTVFVTNSLNADIEKLDTQKTYVSNAYSNQQKLFPADFLKKNKNTNLEPIHSAFCNLVDTINSNTVDYHTTTIAKKFLYELNLLASIRKQIDSDNNRLNRFLMADTCSLLNRMHQGDTSFIFEKTGSSIRHLMIDESQDTSTLQWRNLNIILLETLAQNNQSLVVGDVKQAIYRWRNGNWQYLNSKLKNQVFAKFNPDEQNLSVNYRSLENVVEFNNNIFGKIVDAAQQYHKDNLDTTYADLELAYADIKQEHNDKSGTGYASVQIFQNDSNNKEEEIMRYNTAITDAIYGYIENGVNVNDIAILLRKSKNIRQISELLESDERFKGISIISNEAFELESSIAVNIVIFALRCVYDATDQIAQAALNLYIPDSRILNSFAEQKGSLSEKSIYQAAQTICSIFSLDLMEGQSSYLNTFFDNLSDYLQTGNPTIKDFLEYWGNQLFKTTVPASASNGITLMTVHKSKGLEFHTVIIPYANWELVSYSTSFKSTQIWSHLDMEPYSEVPLLPIEFGNKCKASHFANAYQAEFGMQLVDNLNILYVAMTRAKCNLTILGQLGKNKSVADLIADSLDNVEPEDGCYRYSIGNIVPSTVSKDEESNNPFKFTSSPLNIQSQYFSALPDFKESVAASRFIDSIDMEKSDNTQIQQDRYIQTGQLLHRLFSEIRTKDQEQIDAAIDNLVRQGVIDSVNEKEKIRKFVTKALENDSVAEWFNGNYTLINEGTILFKKNGQLSNRRPDRIMLYNDRTVVVDFKFGKEQTCYIEQVKEYMSCLKEMDMPNVQGYIWYVYSGRVVPVKL